MRAGAATTRSDEDNIITCTRCAAQFPPARGRPHQNLPRTPTVNTLPIGLARNESYPYPCVELLRFTKGGFRSKRFVTSRKTCVRLRNAPGLYERCASTVVNEPM